MRVRLSFHEEFCNTIKPEHYNEALQLIRKWQNFLKHADKDPDGEMGSKYHVRVLEFSASFKSKHWRNDHLPDLVLFSPSRILKIISQFIFHSHRDVSASMS